MAVLVGLLFEYTSFERRIVRISHGLNGQYGAMLWCMLTLPFKALLLGMQFVEGRLANVHPLRSSRIRPGMIKRILQITEQH